VIHERPDTAVYPPRRADEVSPDGVGRGGPPHSRRGCGVAPRGDVVSDELNTLFELAGDQWFLFGLGLAVACLVVGLVSRASLGWTGGVALLVGVGGSTFIMGLFDPVIVAASVGLALATGLLARPVLSEVSTASISFVIGDIAWQPAVFWPVGFSTFFTTAAIWGPKSF